MDLSLPKQLMAGVLVCLLPLVPSSAQTGLSERTRLATIYDTILQARFDQARQQLASACPPAPLEACAALRAVVVWWEIQLDPRNRQLDAQLETAAKAAIAAAERWARREPKQAEAWFYLAGAHAPLEQLRTIRGQRLAVARDALRIKNALERALEIDPTLQDAYFGIGLYHYYADVAPAAVKLLRILLLLPGGNRIEGLNEMLRARDNGALLRAEADYQLHWIYLWYEHQPARALELLRGLDNRYPSNPLFMQRIAEVLRDNLHDHNTSLTAWRTLLERATQRQSEFPEMSLARARIGLAQSLIATSEPNRAVDLLLATIASHPSKPYGAEATANFFLGGAYERLNDRQRAIAAWRAAIASAPSDDLENIRSRARREIARVDR